jgi:gluconate kinase
MSQLIIVTGPGGAGKTTTCEAFAKSAKGTWAFISQDHIRMFVKAGFKDPTEPWDAATRKQWATSQAICGDILRQYQAAGINCILDCFAVKGSFDKWNEVLRGISYKLIVLLPHIDTTLQRNSQRKGAARLKDLDIREHHSWFTAWEGDKRATIIDTTNYEVEETIRDIKAIVGQK